MFTLPKSTDILPIGLIIVVFSVSCASVERSNRYNPEENSEASNFEVSLKEDRSELDALRSETPIYKAQENDE